MLYLAALEGRRRLLGEENKKTLGAMNNMGPILKKMEDYEGALDYYQQARRVQEKILGKTHPDTLDTIYNMALTYGDGLGDRVKEEEMYRQALDGYERSLGKDAENTKNCARNLAILLETLGTRKEDLRKVLTAYPSIEDDEDWYSDEGDDDDEEEDDDDE